MPFTTVASGFDRKNNVIGILRLALAASVLVSHTYILGYGTAEPLRDVTRGQADLGELAVYGFFVLSGFLIFVSARRSASTLRYFWHRFLRIFPAFWVCLAATAFVLAPVLYLSEHGTLSGFWWQSPSPLGYVMHNSWLLMEQYGIGDLLTATPYGRGHGSVFDGALWSLHYEFVCYAIVALLVFVGRRAAGVLTLVLLTALFVVTLATFSGEGRRFETLSLGMPQLQYGINTNQLAVLMLCFLLGSVAAAFPRHFPLDFRMAIGAGVVAVVTAREGYFSVVGVVAFSYVILWAASLSIPRLNAIGTRNDYSYGFYIYAFPVQQTLALIGVPDLGIVVYMAACAAITAVLAALSWHLVERPAMRWKDADLVRSPRAKEVEPSADSEVRPASVTMVQ